jgi:hypothetical protein
VLPRLAPLLRSPSRSPSRAGRPSGDYPHEWGIFEWLPGEKSDAGGGAPIVAGELRKLVTGHSRDRARRRAAVGPRRRSLPLRRVHARKPAGARGRAGHGYCGAAVGRGARCALAARPGLDPRDLMPGNLLSVTAA